MSGTSSAAGANIDGRRDALVEQITPEPPELQVLGIAGGLHLTLQLLPGSNADQVADAAGSEGIDIRSLSYYAAAPIKRQPGLVVGYGRLPLPSVPGVVKCAGAGIGCRVRVSPGVNCFGPIVVGGER